MAYLNGHIALANANMNASYRPTLIDFHGYEGEDFRHFLEILESYFALNNIALDARKLTILKAQLRGAAKVYSKGQNQSVFWFFRNASPGIKLRALLC
ncbi:hypothetical protein G6F57_022121 [Rhizopus arrhizus]|nr:hypothetical protein G6F30_014251 [Rhizopus arrhizus]KAG0971454.1 hypothetical protein G6F29_014144 [Rhizopus arrhizus]KAG0971904.1 hypothetical protein G6F28_014161 [Rhizopus arrhizus]KAG1002748.1 hypothetical protein G6F26_014166 [Rhizopus arrhizus]KAG1078877.1 hypothetical protein G6F39_014327 [Rhizopus arrhizus]